MATKENDAKRRIGRRITAARCYRGWDLDELAKRAGISNRQLARYEATGDITCSDLARVAAAVRLPFSHFVESCRVCGGE